MLALRSRLRGAAVAVSLAPASLLAPASGSAALRWVGPSLAGQRATLAQSAPVDDVFALLGDPASGLASGAMPASGQIVAAQIEGVVALSAGPPLFRVDPKFHLQDLAPAGGGRYRVRATSGFLSLPTIAHPSASAETTVTTVHPVNLCVRRGDLVGFTTDGGFAPAYPHGLAFQVFASVPGAATGKRVAAGGVGNNAIDAFKPLTGMLLLMRVQLATGANASALCPGGTRR